MANKIARPGATSKPLSPAPAQPAPTQPQGMPYPWSPMRPPNPNQPPAKPNWNPAQKSYVQPATPSYVGNPQQAQQPQQPVQPPTPTGWDPFGMFKNWTPPPQPNQQDPNLPVSNNIGEWFNWLVKNLGW
jgi:hypothetical protein